MQPLSAYERIKKLITETGASPADLRREFPNLPPPTIYKYRAQAIRDLSAEGITPPTPPSSTPTRRGFHAFAKRKPLSARHLRIGAQLSRVRFKAGALSPTEWVAKYPQLVSAIRLRQMELGFHDFSLSELELVAQLIGKSLSELMEEPNNTQPDRHLTSVP